MSTLRIAVYALLTFSLGSFSLTAQDPAPDFEQAINELQNTMKTVKGKTPLGEEALLSDYMKARFNAIVAQRPVGRLKAEDRFNATLDAMGEVGPDLYGDIKPFLKDNPAGLAQLEKAFNKITSTPVHKFVRSPMLKHADVGFGGRLFVPSLLAVVHNAKTVGPDGEEWCPWCEFQAIKESKTPPAADKAKPSNEGASATPRRERDYQMHRSEGLRRNTPNQVRDRKTH